MTQACGKYPIMSDNGVNIVMVENCASWLPSVSVRLMVLVIFNGYDLIARAIKRWCSVSSAKNDKRC